MKNVTMDGRNPPPTPDEYAAAHGLHEVLQTAVARALRERPANASAAVGAWLIEAGGGEVGLPLIQLSLEKEQLSFFTFARGARNFCETFARKFERRGHSS